MRVRIKTLMVIVLLVGGFIAASLPPAIACIHWLHDKNAWFSVGPFTVRF